MREQLRISIPVKDFHLEHIFDCGQCFRWNRNEDGSYTGIAGGRAVRMEFQPAVSDSAKSSASGAILKTEGLLTITGLAGAEVETEEDFHNFWYDYLDLGRDYGKIKRSLGRGDANMRRAIKAGQGIRILKQDFWETMVSFIISQNNNIPRIKGCIESLCEQFGEQVTGPDGLIWYDIPGPEVLASLKREDLDSCRLGYRAPYLIETARQVLERGGAEAVKEELSREKDAIAALTDFAGVGPKVASCIALFGVGRFDAFPIDVWMRRAMHTVYNIEENRVKEMQEYAAEHFGKYGGIAQQYLFYYIRGL